jgi:hypothetical protein
LELEKRLRALEGGDAPRPGGFLGGYWGSRQAEEPRSSVPQVGGRTTPSSPDARLSAAPMQPQQSAPAASGGFMRSALATAAGVAGGMLLADSVRNMLGGGTHATPAAPSTPRETQASQQADQRDTEADAYDVASDSDDFGDDGGGIEI